MVNKNYRQNKSVLSELKKEMINEHTLQTSTKYINVRYVLSLT